MTTLQHEDNDHEQEQEQVQVLTREELRMKKARLANTKYKILGEIGSGSFGCVYKVIDRVSCEEYAMKVEPLGDNSRLRKEYNIYTAVQKLSGGRIDMPKIIDFFETERDMFMVMELMGKSLDDLFQINEKFDETSVLSLAVVLISLLEKLHNTGYIHRDIKPNNFLTGLGKNKKRLYIMDFGLSKKYIKDNGKHIDMHTNRSLVGTARYASINVHMGFEPSRRDDLESVGYMLVYFLKGSLPWQGLKKNKEKGGDHDSHIKLIGECKAKTSVSELCDGLPECFEKYINYCKKLEFDQTPNYRYLKHIFVDVMHQNELKATYTWRY